MLNCAMLALSLRHDRMHSKETLVFNGDLQGRKAWTREPGRDAHFTLPSRPLAMSNELLRISKVSVSKILQQKKPQLVPVMFFYSITKTISHVQNLIKQYLSGDLLRKAE